MMVNNQLLDFIQKTKEQLQTTEASISALEQRLTEIRTTISMEMFVGMDVSSMENLKVITEWNGVW